MKKILISDIEKDSIAEELEINKGDVLISVNEVVPKDILEYMYLISEEYLTLEVKKPDGEIWQYEIDKDYDENLGLIFDNEIIDEPKRCHNKCIFCFIDQMPKGMRDSLYFKDDDSRLSFLQGNYVTLTNMNDEEIQKIINYRIQPINISVHTTNPELRASMLNNKDASKIKKLLKKFYDNEINMNIQIVLCPDYNDKEELDSTIKDLMKFYPYINSVSIVPVGLTKYRQGLKEIRQFTNEECKNAIKHIAKFQKIMKNKYNTNLFFPSDEFFIKGDIEIPNYEYYEHFYQLENGVGMLALFLYQCKTTLKNEYININKKNISIATGEYAFDYMSTIINDIMDRYPQIKINLYKIPNNFFGQKVKVSGLLTGKDLLEGLDNKDLGDILYIPDNMLKHKEHVFLDDITVEELEKRLKIKVIPVEVHGGKFIEAILY